MKMEFHIPRPPSVNGLYINRRGGRAISKGYEAWLQRAGYAMNGQYSTTLYDAAIVSMWVDKKNADLSNLEKASLDLLVKHRVLADDSQVVQLHMYHDEQAGDIMFLTVQGVDHE